MSDYLCREMTADDAESVLSIFNHYVKNSFAAYPEQPVGPEFFAVLMKASAGYPRLVAVDQTDTVVGFAMLRPYHPMPAFAATAEISSFIAPSHTGHGIGQILLDRLIAGARAKGITNIMAGISGYNEPSIKFHRKHGFVECGKFLGIGRKRGMNFDVVWMQLHLD